MVIFLAEKRSFQSKIFREIASKVDNWITLEQMKELDFFMIQHQVNFLPIFSDKNFGTNIFKFFIQTFGRIPFLLDYEMMSEISQSKENQGNNSRFRFLPSEDNIFEFRSNKIATGWKVDHHEKGYIYNIQIFMAQKNFRFER